MSSNTLSGFKPTVLINGYTREQIDFVREKYDLTDGTEWYLKYALAKEFRSERTIDATIKRLRHAGTPEYRIEIFDAEIAKLTKAMQDTESQSHTFQSGIIETLKDIRDHKPISDWQRYIYIYAHIHNRLSSSDAKYLFDGEQAYVVYDGVTDHTVEELDKERILLDIIANHAMYTMGFEIEEILKVFLSEMIKE